MEVAIIGIGAASVSFTEYYSVNVLTRYTELISPLKAIFNKNPSSLTASDYDLIQNQIASLKQLARDGIEENVSTGNFRSFMNEDMVVHLNDIMRTLSIVGIPPAAGAPPLSNDDKVATLIGWQNLPNFQIDVLGHLNKALSLLANANQYTIQVRNPGTGAIVDLNVIASPERTLQSMLQLEYIEVGNSQMAGKMALLEEGLALSQKVLITLTAVQNIANQIQVSTKIPEFVMPAPMDDVLEYRKAYKAAASAYFTQIFPSAIPVANAAQQLLNAKQTLYNQLLELEKVTPPQTFGSGSTAIIRLARSAQGTLANAVYKVIQDITTVFSGVSTHNNPQLQDQLFTAVKKWIIDNQDVKVSETGSQNNAGAIQDRVTAAIKTAQNLEESQREDVRRYLFIFQEFYKSAASMLQLLEQIFDKINRGITRQ